MSCRRCASSPARTPSSTGSACSPPATPTWRATAHSLHGSGSLRSAMKREAPALEAALAQLEAAQLRRARVTVEQRARTGRSLTLEGGRELIDFSSNDYLGLAGHPALARAVAECAAHRGTGSGASHLITGHGAEHARLEEELAAFTHRERALLFSTGYVANLPVISPLPGRRGRVVLDRLRHASLIVGPRLSGPTPPRSANA